MAAAAAPNEDALQAEDSSDEIDSVYGSDLSAYTETLRSSLLDSVKENGRAYHTYHDGAYIMPDDEQERRRLDMQHEIFLRTFGRKLILAPTPKKQKNVRKCPAHAILLSPDTGLLTEMLRQSRPWHWYWSLGYGLCRHASRSPSSRRRPKPDATDMGPTELQVRSHGFRGHVDISSEIRPHPRANALLLLF